MPESTHQKPSLSEQNSLTARIGWALLALIATGMLVGLWKAIATYDFFSPMPLGLKEKADTKFLVLSLLMLPIAVGITLSTWMLCLMHPENVTLKPKETLGSHYLLAGIAGGAILTTFCMIGFSMATHESWLKAFPHWWEVLVMPMAGAGALGLKSLGHVLGVSGSSM